MGPAGMMCYWTASDAFRTRVWGKDVDTRVCDVILGRVKFFTVHSRHLLAEADTTG